LGGGVALFVLIIVGLVVAQTWLDWRDANMDWVIPEWAKGMALAGVVAVSLAAATSAASVWLQDQAGQAGSGFGSQVFCLELGFLLCMMGVVIFAARKKRLRLMILVATLVVIASVWLGTTLTP
jgi:hypothetical protein